MCVEVLKRRPESCPKTAVFRSLLQAATHGSAKSKAKSSECTGWGPLVISRVIRALNWVIRTLS